MVLAVTPALASTITITAFDGATTSSITGASSPATFGAGFGSWSVQVTGTGTPPLSSGDLTSNVIAAYTGSSASTLTVWITESTVTSPLGPTLFAGSIDSGTLTGSITSEEVKFAVQTNNTIPGPAVPLGSSFFDVTFAASGTSSSFSGFAVNVGAGPYSLTQQYIFTANATGRGSASPTSSFTASAVNVVPEPASLLLLGTGLAAAVVARYRRRR